jgi:RNA polymerase-binding transcription factor DksA
LALTDEMVQQALQRLKEEEGIVQAELDDLGFTSDGKVDVHFDEGFADAAQTTSERARVLSLADGLKQRLDDLQAAIHRVEAGTYGKCERCGQDIAPERLEAVPAARLCIRCANKK